MLGLRRNSKTLPKAKLAPKKGHDHCLVVYCQSDPLQLSESQQTITSEKYIQQINEKPWKPATSSASTGQQNGPNSFMTMSSHTSHNQCFKVEQSWAIKFYLIHIFTDLSPTDYHIFKDQENASTTRRKQKMLPRDCGIWRNGFLHYRNKQAYFLLAKCVDCNDSCFN